MCWAMAYPCWAPVVRVCRTSSSSVPGMRSARECFGGISDRLHVDRLTMHADLPTVNLGFRLWVLGFGCSALGVGLWVLGWALGARLWALGFGWWAGLGVLGV